MTAIACLRLLIDDATFPAERAQVAADVYLKARWKAPRRYGSVAPLAFVLADNRAEQLDPTEMQALAAELEASLFPGRKSGQVCLMTFEGDESAVLKFASLTQAELQGLVAGDGYGGAAGRVQVITADAIRSVPSTHEEARVAKAEAAAVAAAPTVLAEPASVEPPPVPPAAPVAEPAPGAPPAQAEKRAAPTPIAPKAKEPPPPPPPSQTGWWGLYDLQADAFVGSVIGLRADLDQPPPDQDSALLTRDLACLNDAQTAFKTAPFGDFYLPFGFWNLTTPSSQEAYKRRLSRYPLDLQPRLGASVHGTPREASLGLVQQMRAFLKSGFAFLDLNVIDPTFPVHNLPPELIDSVTLSLPDADERERINAIIKFIERQGTYRGKDVAQCVSGLRTSNELEACRQGGIARVQGPAITAFLDKPLTQAEGAPLAAARDAA